jgi:YD repeat-containing protein
LNQTGYNLGNLIEGNQLIWRESYEYDLNGNRVGKTMPWGKIRYTYDGENRLVKKGDIVYTYDKDGQWFFK